MASAILAESQPDTLIAAYKNILNRDPHDEEAHLGLAAIYRKQGHKNRAALSYELAAQALAAKGKMCDALATVQLIIDMSPENVSRRIRLAEQYERANMHPEAVREFSAAESYLRGKNLPEEYARVVDRLRALHLKGSEAESPSGDAAGRAVASQQTLGKTDPQASSSQYPSGDSTQQPTSAGSAAPGLIAEADSFLRLGLVDKAVEHLEAALVRNPFLRALREPLATLYVARRQYKRAVGELWELLSQCTDRQQEIRILRYILRLDSTDRAAQQQLGRLLSSHEESPARGAEPVPPSIAAVDDELRQSLVIQRPPTDLVVTSVIQLSDSLLAEVAVAASSPQPLVPMDLPPAAVTDRATPDLEFPLLPSATTRPGLAQIGAIAEEIALSSQSFREKLAEIDRCVREANYDEALHRLNILASCYPNSQTIWAQVAEIEHVQQELAVREGVTDQEPASNFRVSTETVTGTRALFASLLSPSQCTPTLTALLSENRKGAVRTTIEIVPADIEEVFSCRPAEPETPVPQP